MLAGSDTQISAFLERQPSDLPDQSAETPLVIFRTAMELTREQEDRLVQQFFSRKADLETDLGREQVKNDSSWSQAGWGTSAEDMKFLCKRALMEMVYHQKMEWRRTVMGGIFDQGQNVHMPFCRRIVQQMIARANNYFFSTDPYFSVNPMPAPGVDTDKANQADAFAKYKFERARVKAALEKAIEKAFIRGEAVIKTRHWTDAVRFETNAKVAVDAAGNPLVAKDGDYIYDTDPWILRPQIPPDQQAAVDQAGREGQPVDLTQFPQAMTLERDANTLLPPEALVFAMRKIRKTVTRYSGPEAANVHPEDFLFPLNCPDLQRADMIAHIYDIPAIELVMMYIERLKAMGQYDPDEFPRVLELLRTAPQGMNGTAAAQPRTELGESSSSTSLQNRADPALNIAEAYLTMDVNGDGQYEEVFLMIDLTTRRPIIYDHLPNVFPNSKRPFHNIVINPVEGRCHGIGMMEVFWELQKFVDLTINRWDLSMSQSGAVTFWHPELTVEGANNPALRLNAGGTYRKRDPKVEAKHIVERIWLNEFKGANLEHLVQFVAQMMTNMSGVGSINDAAMAGLNTSKLATGVRNMDKSGQEQFAPFLSHLEPGIVSVLESLLYLTLWHMDEVEVFHVLEDGKTKPLEIQAIDVRTLTYQVNLELTRYKGEQQVAEAQAARQCILTFYSLPIAIQERTIALFKQELKAYGVQDTDEMLQPLDNGGQPMPGAQSMADQVKAGAAPTQVGQPPGQSHELT